MKRTFNYGDVNLIPKYFDGFSRSNLNTNVVLGKHEFKSPAIPSNMESIINEDLCVKLAENNYFYVMHRFGTDLEQFIKNMKSKNLITSISIGVKDEDKEIITKLMQNNLDPDYLTIDIAHGHSKMMKDALTFYRNLLPTTFIIAGNVATKQGILDLQEWGADAVKFGIAPGFVCFVDGTKVKTINGYKNIEDIIIGDYVLTHTNEYKEVINTTSYISNETKININGNISTIDHQYYVINKSDKDKINDNNYTDFAYYIEANKLDKTSHLIVALP